MVERELGAAVADVFGSFDPEPMASGSVAQVHRATLRDGTRVAVRRQPLARGYLREAALSDALAYYALLRGERHPD